MRPVKVRSDDELVAALRGRREQVGMTQGALDDRVGWPDAYTAKLEAPHRKFGKSIAGLFTNALFDWLQGLGLTLVLMDAREADALIAAHTAAPVNDGAHRAYPGRDAKRPALPVRETRLVVRLLG